MENALRFERSPYLLQHKSNPVYWLPWGEEARRRALEEDKPMLVSVGYAACHWCHVMAEESFSDPRTAALMNELFVNVKVDREERPDVDAFCVRALQAMGKRPGWPLTIFMTPDGRPFWGGTYFPPEDRGELPAFATVLQKIGELYRSDHATVLARAESFIGAFAHADGGSDGDVTAELVLEAAEELLSNIDMNHGGLKGAPKFPFPPLLRFLWSMGARQGRSDFQDAVVATLDGMLDGGIYDQLGGGFARYAVDEQWLVPHFEKMLYDNAQLIAVLAELWRVKRVPRYAQAVRQTIDWVTREMTLAGGAFASSLGAVSEGGEGRFYLWHEKEVNVLLGPDAALFKRVYGVTAQGNFQGRNVLNRASAPSDFDAQQERILERCRAVLLEARGSRPRPQRDEKILADWNGLAIHALAKAALILDEPAWLDRGRSAFDFIVRELCVDGTLHHAWCDGSLQKTRVLDDYAQMSRAAVALYEATAEHEYLEHCERWVNVALSLFADDHSGALAFSADATLAARIVDGRDAAMPSGNGTLCEVLARLFYLTGDERYRSRCKRVVGSFAGRVGEDGFQLATLFDAALQLTSAAQVIVTGARDDASTRALSRAAYELAPPDSLIVTLAPSSRVPGALSAKAAAAQVPTAYVCVGTTCLEPAHNASELRRVLAGVFPSH